MYIFLFISLTAPLELLVVMLTRLNTSCFEHKLLKLFESCPIIGAGRSKGYLDRRVNTGYGTLVKINQKCSNCSYTRTWDSQPHSHHMPAGNLILSGAILYFGSQVSQVLRLFSIMNIKCYSPDTYQRHQVA